MQGRNGLASCGWMLCFLTFNVACSRVGFVPSKALQQVDQQSLCEAEPDALDCQVPDALLGKLKIFTIDTWDKEEPQYISDRDVLLRLEPSEAAEVWLNEAGAFEDLEGVPGLSIDAAGVLKLEHRLEGNEGVVKVWAMFRGKEAGQDVVVSDDVVLDLTDPNLQFTDQGIVKVPAYIALAKIDEANLDTIECKGPGELAYGSCADSLSGLDFSRTTAHLLDNNYTLQVLLKDKAGRTKEITHRYQVDSHKPKIILQNSPTGRFNADTVALRFQAIDSYDGNLGSGIEKFYCSFDGGASFVEGTANNCEVKATTSVDVYELLLKTPEAKVYNLVLKAQDRAGHESEASEVVSFEIDRSQPTLTVSPPAFYQTSNSVTIPFQGSWPNGGNYTVKYECSLASGGVVVQTAAACEAPSKIVTGLATSEPGKEYVETIKAIFTRGNELPYEVIKEVKFFVDLADPTVALAFAPGQANPTNGTTANVLITAADVGSGLNANSLQCYLQKSGSAAALVPCTLGASTLSIAGLADGAYNIYYLIKDLAGRGPIRSNTITLNIDRTASPISISGPGLPMAGYPGIPNRVDASAKPKFQIGVDASVNAASGVKCSLVGLFTDLACGGASFVLPKNLPATGLFELLVKVVDKAGNESQNTYKWAYDTTPPDVGIGTYSANSYTGSSTSVNFVATDLMSEIASVTCYLQRPHAAPVGTNCPFAAATSGNLLSVRGDFAITNTTEGVYEFWVEATDKSGNKGVSAHGSYTVTVELKLVDKEKLLRSVDNKKIDVLVMLDTSGSMKEDLKVIAAKFNNFLNVLAGYDWRIAFVVNANTEGDRVICNVKAGTWYTGKTRCPIVGGDYSSHAAIAWSTGHVWNESVPGFDGRLLDIDGAEGTFWITPATANSSNLFFNTIQVHAAKKSGFFAGKSLPGTQHERSLFALQRVLARTKDGSFNNVNKNFFRANTHLAVINISDEDETNYFYASSTDLKYMDASKYLLPCVGTVTVGKPCKIKHNTALQTYNFVKQTFPDKNFVFNSIVEFPPGITDEKDDAGWNSFCAGKASRHVTPGCYYREMSQMTGGKVVNIGVQGSYTQYLEEIGEVTKQLARKVDLDCAPYENKVELMINTNRVTIPYVIKGQTVEYQQDLPLGDYTVKYKCVVP